MARQFVQSQLAPMNRSIGDELVSYTLLSRLGGRTKPCGLRAAPCLILVDGPLGAMELQKGVGALAVF